MIINKNAIRRRAKDTDYSYHSAENRMNRDIFI